MSLQSPKAVAKYKKLSAAWAALTAPFSDRKVLSSLRKEHSAEFSHGLSAARGVEAAARRDPATGKFYDFNTGEMIPDRYDLGHRSGDEFWRLRDKAMADGLTQKQFNDLLNNPDLYRIELPANNRSHRYEMPR